MVSLATRLEAPVLAALEHHPMTIKELSEYLNANYYTVRKTVVSLRERNMVSTLGYHMRDAKYQIADGSGPNLIMPTILQDGKRNKMIDYLALATAKSSKGGKAVENVPMWIVRLLMVAKRLQGGEPIKDQQRSLAGIKSGILEDIGHLKRVIDVYEQILNNPRNWNADDLSKYPNDQYWNEETIYDAYHKFFDQ